MIRRLRPPVLGALGFAVLLGSWIGAVTMLKLRPVILPGPEAVGARLLALVQDGSLFRDLATSFREFGAGFLTAAVGGVVLGAVLARSDTVFRYVNPLVDGFRVVIPFSLVPLAIVWFGLSETGKVFVVWYACLFVIVVNTLNGMQNVDPVLVRAGRMIGLREPQLTIRVIIPAALPRIMTGMQLALSLGWISVIAAEYLGASSGIGYLITNGAQGLETDTVLAGMLVIGVAGALLSIAGSALSRMLTPYQQGGGW